MSARAPLADEAARDAARRALGESLLVEAGAGTGKTTLIVERIANLVDAGVPLDRIVAITFTEKAAGELKLRVRRALELRSADASRDERARHRSREALASIERAAISTIHAWCARLLRDHPVEAAVDPLFTVLDGSAREALFDRVWHAWIVRELAAEHDPPFRDVSLYTPEEWLKALRRIARHLLDHRAWLPAAIPEEIGGDPAGFAERTLRAFDPGALAAQSSDPDDLLVAALQRAAALRGRFLEATPDIRREMLLRHENLAKGSYRSVGQKGNWGGAGIAPVREAITAAQDGWIAARAAMANDLLVRVARWLRDGFVVDYEAEKRQAGVLDFEDLLVRARDLLRDNAAVRRRVRRGLHLILDEFQDTDPVQCEAAFRLAADDAPGDWRQAAPAPGALFLVGDPKQSIYAFRGADVETYTTARGLLEERRAVRAISTNFRSRASLLEWINACFTTLLAPPASAEAARYEIAYAPLGIHHAANADGNGVHVLRPAKETGFDSIGRSRDAEARAVAALLRDHARGRWTVRDPRTDADRPARFGDMVVLLRNRTSSLPAFEGAFRAAGIPYVVVGGRALWARAEVRALTALCAAIENPFDGVSLVAALKSPFFGASDADLLLWRHRHGAVAAHPGLATRDEPGVVGAALARIARWHDCRLEMPPARLLEDVFTETGAIASFGLKPDGAQRIANLLRLLDAARAGAPEAPDAIGSASASGAPLSFRAWVGWLTERATDVREEAEGAILEENADAVRILTIHAAKGLEFPVVVLGDLAAKDPNGDSQLFNRATGQLALRISARDRSLETANFEETKEEVDRRENAENLRLLYVAATRARDSLIVPLFAPKARESFYKTLTEAFPALLTEPEALAPAAGGPARVWIAGDDVRPIEGEPPVFRLPTAALEAALALQRRAEPAAPFVDADAEALAARISLRARPRLVQSVTRILPTDDGPRPFTPPATGLTPEEAALVGTSVHAALELGDLGAAANLEANARLQARARFLGDAAVDRAARLARAAASIPAVGRARSAPRLLREWPFMLPVGEGLLEGVVDVAWVEDGGLVILDWKTDALPHGDEAAVRADAEHHFPQLLSYAWALGRVTGLAPRSVIVALLDAGREIERRVTPEDLEAARSRVEAAFAAASPAGARR